MYVRLGQVRSGYSNTDLIHFNSFSVEQSFTNDVLGVRVAQLRVGVRHGEVERVEVEVARVHRDQAK